MGRMLQRDVKLAYGKHPGRTTGMRVQISLRPTQFWGLIWFAEAL